MASQQYLPIPNIAREEEGSCLWRACHAEIPEEETWQAIRQAVAERLSDQDYRRRILTGQIWPGRQEIAIIASLYNRRIEVYVEQGTLHYKRIASFGCPRGRVIKLLYSTRQGIGHYELLQMLEAETRLLECSPVGFYMVSRNMHKRYRELQSLSE